MFALMYSKIGFISLIGMIFACFQIHAGELTLVADGKSNSTIILSSKPTKAAQLAAFELRAHVELITGVALAIVTEDKKTDGVRIYVGDCKFVRDLGITNDKLKKQEYVIRFLPDSVILKGKDKSDFGKVEYQIIPKHSKKRKPVYACPTWPGWWDEKGTLTATYDFLKKFCGVRWFDCTDYGTDYKKRKTLTINAKDIKRFPAFSFRNAYTYPNLEGYDADCGLWHRGSAGYKEYEKLAFAKTHADFPLKYIYRSFAKRNMIKAFLYRNLVGGEKFGANHSMYNYYDRFWRKNPKNPDVFKAGHLNFFSQGEMRDGRPTQLCYSTPAVVKRVSEDANGWFEGRALDQTTGRVIKDFQRDKFSGENFFAVVPMDNDRWCECEKCQRQLGKRPNPATFSNGMASDYVWKFVNQIAKSLKMSHPDKKVAALAYASYSYFPENVKLEDNISVQLCLTIRNVYDSSVQKNDWMFFEKWSGEGNRALYLWLYYTFPTERCNRTKNPETWHCFPGFFAHHIGSAFKKYHKSGVKGAFFNGFGQDVEAYVTFAMLDDPSADVDQLLDEYFSRMYGPAGQQLHYFYNRVEDIYCNPENYPTDSPGHQTEVYAWSFLGTIDRMKELRSVMDQAEVAIAKATDIQKKRFDVFKLAIWSYMLKGKEKYQKSISGRSSGKSLHSPFMIGGPACGDLKKVKWEDGQGLDGWKSRNGEGTRREIRGDILHDDKFLYLRLEELNAPDKLVLTRGMHGDRWQILIADKNGKKPHCLLVASDGSFLAYVDNGKGQESWNLLPKVASKHERGRWSVVLALPFAELEQLGIVPGGAFRLNVVRRSGSSEDQPSLSQTFGPFENTKRFARVTLDSMRESINPAKSAASDQGLIGRWSFEGSGKVAKDSSDQKNHGEFVGKIKRVNGPFGKALALKYENGVGCQYVEIDKPKGFDDLEAFSMSCWMNIDPLWSYDPISYYTIASGLGGMHCDLRPIGKLFFQVTRKDKKQFYHQAYMRTFSPGKWGYLAITYDGELMRTYVNGRLIDKGKKGDVVLSGKSESLRIGANTHKRPHFQFKGKLDELEFHNRALAPGEVVREYERGLKKIREMKE